MASPVAAEKEPETIRLLTVGNSFAENALTYLPQLAEAAGCRLIVGKATLGGCTLERHWRHAAAFEENPESEEGSPYAGGRLSLDALLKKEAWDFVTIQQVSYRSHDLDTYYPYARNLHRYIRERAPHARVVAHQIWAYRVDDPRFVPRNEGKEPHTQEEMYRQVREAYHTLAAELNLAGIIPSGDAMFLADTDPTWGYRPDTEFDFQSAEPPSLPNQEHSLHTGWYWKKDDEGKRTLRIDGHHASNAGKYLLGCLWFEVLFGESVVDNGFVPEGLDPAYAQFLRRTAHHAAKRNSARPAAVAEAPGKIGEPRIVIPAPENERFAHLSWPKIVTALDGTLVTAYIAGRKHVNGDGCPAISVSTDQGKTFSEPKILREFDTTMPYQHGANLALGVAQDGAIVLMVMAFTNDERNSIFGWRSGDSGKTWTPTDTSSLADNQTGSVFGHVFPVPGKGLAVCGHYRKPKGNGIWIAFSQDHGESWGDPQTITDRKYFEPAFLYSEGKLIGLIRENDAHAYHQYVSNDLGELWEAKEKALQGNPSAVHPSPFLVEDPANPGQLYALQSERGAKHRIHLWKATAAELDWEHVSRVVEVANDRDFSYPWMTPLENGKWFLVYYSGEKDGPNPIWGLELSLP